MKLIVKESTGEIIGIGDAIPEDCIQINVPDSFKFTMTTIMFDSESGIIKTPGTILTNQDIANLEVAAIDLVNRADKIRDEVNSLIGLNVLTMTDAQRWKLLAIVLYKLGVINTNGIVQPMNNWLEV